MTLVPAEVKLDHRWEDKYKNDDLWTIDGKTFNLTKVAMSKLSSASGVVYSDSRIAYRELDEITKRVTYIKHNVMWRKTDLSGVDLTGISTGEYSYYEDLARYRHKDDKYKFEYDKSQNKYVKTNTVIAKKGEPITEQIERRRNFAGSFAETNAKVRAFSEAVCEIPKSFTLEELKKPFLLVRAVANVQHILNQHPELQPVYGAQILGIANIVYGQPQNQTNQILIAPETHSLPLNNTQYLPEANKENEEPEPISGSEKQREYLTEADLQKMSLDKIVEKAEELMKEADYSPKTPPSRMDREKVKVFVLFLQEELKKKSVIK
jgi:hypothetical protein